MEKQYEPGLYQYDGTEFRKLEPSGEIKLPVSEEAVEAVKATRKAAQAVIGMRPELSLTASAMLLEAAKLPAIADAVRDYGLHVYSSRDSSTVTNVTAGDTPGDTPAQKNVVEEVPAEAQAEPAKPVSSYVD